MIFHSFIGKCDHIAKYIISFRTLNQDKTRFVPQYGCVLIIKTLAQGQEEQDILYNVPQ